MFLWIELLVFGFAFIVDAQDSDWIQTTVDPNSEAGGIKNLDRIQTNVEPNSKNLDWSQTPVESNLEDLVPLPQYDETTFTKGGRPREQMPPVAYPNFKYYPLFPLVDCTDINIKVARYQYNSQGVTAELEVTKEPELLNVSCENAHCTWDKNQNTLAGLQECDEYKIVASFNECDESRFSIHVPPETDKWKLEDPPKNSTSVTLSWNSRGSDRCHLRYFCQCHPHGKNFSTTEEQNSCTVTGLSPNKNYNCSSEILFNGEIVKTDYKQITTDYGKPTPVRELQVNPLNQEISAVEIKCREPEQINGREEEYYLYLSDGETAIKTNKTCYFEVTDLCHSATYQFKVIFYNGKYFSEPVISSPVETRYFIYNYGNLETSFAFLIIGKSLALLLVLCKIHNLIKKNSRDQDVAMALLNRDYENCGPLSRTMDAAEQTEPLTGSQMCTSVTSPGKA